LRTRTCCCAQGVESRAEGSAGRACGAGEAPSLPRRRCRRIPAVAGSRSPLDRQPRQPAYGTRPRQSRLAISLRRGPGRTPSDFGIMARRRLIPNCSTGLRAGSSSRLVGQETAPTNPIEQCLSHEQALAQGIRGRRSGEPTAVAASVSPAGRRGIRDLGCSTSAGASGKMPQQLVLRIDGRVFLVPALAHAISIAR